ncbi:hypothetical protein GCM10010430_43750 [Kitasatospora cystarginea]|uniref:Uncharacterized protein n=1 Tax=Kitasatospora cystarginea TaxID=58350 RepID=A0ABN3EDB9_9ACTN
MPFRQELTHSRQQGGQLLFEAERMVWRRAPMSVIVREPVSMRET